MTGIGNWDQDRAAVKKAYWKANAHATAVLLGERAAAAAKVWATPTPEQWDWPATRANGSQFTPGSLGVYFLHDLVHHVHDVAA